MNGSDLIGHLPRQTWHLAHGQAITTPKATSMPIIGNDGACRRENRVNRSRTIPLSQRRCAGHFKARISSCSEYDTGCSMVCRRCTRVDTDAAACRRCNARSVTNDTHACKTAANQRRIRGANQRVNLSRCSGPCCVRTLPIAGSWYRSAPQE